MSPAFRIDVVNDDDGAVVWLIGQFDLTAGEFVEETLKATIATSQSVVVDLSQTRFIDSAGLTALVMGWRAAQDSGCGFRLRGQSEPIRQVLAMSRLDRLFNSDQPSTEL